MVQNYVEMLLWVEIRKLFFKIFLVIEMVMNFFMIGLAKV